MKQKKLADQISDVSLDVHKAFRTPGMNNHTKSAKGFPFKPTDHATKLVGLKKLDKLQALMDEYREAHPRAILEGRE